MGHRPDAGAAEVWPVSGRARAWGHAGEGQRMITVAEVWAYARCPFRHFWRYKARIAPLPTARGLIGEHVRRALSSHYAHAGAEAAKNPERPSVMACVGAVWRRTMDEWGCGSSLQRRERASWSRFSPAGSRSPMAPHTRCQR